MITESNDDVLSRYPLIDGHNDLPGILRSLRGCSVEGLDRRIGGTHTDIPRLRQGRVGAQFWSAWVPSDLPEPEAVVATLEQVDLIERLISRFPETFGRARSADDLEREFSNGRIASLIGIEGGHSIAGSLGVLRMFARLGVRYMTLTHNDDTPWAASATGTRQTSGLNAIGKSFIAEMNRIGMIVDLSHTARSTQLDALDSATSPVIFSHSSIRSVTDHPRNVSDDVLARLAQNGGVVQVTFVPDFVSQACSDWTRKETEKRADLDLNFRPDGPAGEPSLMVALFGQAPAPGETSSSAAARNEEARRVALAKNTSSTAQVELDRWISANPQPRATLNDVAKHMEVARQMIGIDHLGVGGDFDGVTSLPLGLEDVGTYPALFEELRSRKWSDSDLRKLAGQNILRVMRAVEDSASERLWIP